MKPYPEYKPTGLAWLPEIPRHWKSAKLRNLLSIVSKKNHPEQPLLSVVREKGVIRRDVDSKEENHNYIPEDLSNYKVVRKGQFAMNKMKAWQGSYGISQYDGIVSPAYFVFDLHGVSADFFNIAIRSKAYIPYFAQASDGIRVGQWDLSLPRMHEIPFFIPPADEQAQIVRYLDAMTAKINKLIRAKKRQIALFQEQKQAIINQAVTRGLDPDVELKDSGQRGSNSGWIEKPLKYFVKSNLNSLSQTTNKNFQFHYLDISSVGFGYIKTQPESMFFADAPSRARRIVEYGDTIISTVRTYLRSMCFIDSSLKDCIVSTGFCVLHPSKDIIPEILWYFLSADSFVNLVIKNSIGVSYPAIAESRLLSIKIQLPLCKNEQKNIIGFIESSTNKINQAQKALRNGIEILQEYKNTLIAAIVTGQVDVRNIAVEAVSAEDLTPSDDPDESEEQDSLTPEESEE